MSSRFRKFAVLVLAVSCLIACDPQVYGSIGISSSFNSYDRGPHMTGSLSIGGRLH